MRSPSFAILACLLGWAPAAAQDPGPFSCPNPQVAVRDPRTGEWSCRARLKKTRDVFADEEKADDDPCPDGYWWHKSKTACAPVVCTEEPNSRKLGKPCPTGHHPHLAGGGDWTRPLVCVEDYLPKHEGTGGKNPRPGGCDLCLQNEPNHRPGRGGDGWRFERPESPEARRRREGQEGGPAPARASPASLGSRSSGARFVGRQRPRAPGAGNIAGLAAACGAAAAQVKTPDGRRLCWGGLSEGDCPSGTESVEVGDGAFGCAPCASGQRSVVVDERARCLADKCEPQTLPVPGDGGDAACAAPVEGLVDWKRVEAERAKAGRPPRACPAGDAPAWHDGAWDCVPCPGRRLREGPGGPYCAVPSRLDPALRSALKAMKESREAGAAVKGLLAPATGQAGAAPGSPDPDHRVAPLLR